MSGPHLVHLQPGAVFAKRYRVERLLRAGGMGAVYVVTHLGTERLRALKVMLPVIVENREARMRFDQEARVGARIDSPYIVDVVDAGVDDETGMPFLVMELLSGKVMSDLIDQYIRLPAPDLVEYLAQTARGLDRAHAAGVVHRDLKPENIFVCLAENETPRVKILDFGIAKILAGTTGKSTQAGGTPLFMAPEQTSRSMTVSPATDIWALGLIAYNALVGRSYWESPDIQTLYREILIDDLEPPCARAFKDGVRLPPSFDTWFFRCVARNPAARFQRASDAVAALATSLSVPLSITSSITGRPLAALTPLSHAATLPSRDGLPVLATASPFSHSTSQSHRRSRKWVLPVVVVVTLAALTALGAAIVPALRSASSASVAASQPSLLPSASASALTTASAAPSSAPSPSPTLVSDAVTSASMSAAASTIKAPSSMIPLPRASACAKPIPAASPAPTKHRGSYEVE